MLMKKLTAFAILGAVAMCSQGVFAAEPEWTPESLSSAIKALPAGSVDAGREVHAKRMCAGCHGPEGIAQMGAFPHVAGQPTAVTLKSMLDYRSGRRAQGAQAMMMAGMAASLNDQQIADLAAYYDAIPGGQGVAPKADSKAKTIDMASVMTLVKKGDRTRGITPCTACHGSTSAGNIDGEVPVLQGQNPEYLKATLKSYRSGERHSDLLKEMRVFAKALTDEEIEGLSNYYGSLKGRGVPSAKPAAPEKKE